MACLALELHLSGETATEGEALSPRALDEGGAPVIEKETQKPLAPKMGDKGSRHILTCQDRPLMGKVCSSLSKHK